MKEEVFYITIKPTNKVDGSGYKTGIVTCFNNNNEAIADWECDSFWTIGNLQCDFEADGGVKIWAFDGKSLIVDSGYTTRIEANILDYHIGGKK